MKASIRAAGLGVAVGLALAACGSAGVPDNTPDAPIHPAALLLTEEQAERFVPDPIKIEPEGEGTEVPDAVAPTAFAADTREQGPPGNPVATSLSDPPAAGIYPFKIFVQGGFGSDESEFSINVEESKTVRGGRRQIHTWEIEQFPQEYQYRYTSQELLLERVTSTDFSGQTIECEFDPPSVALKLPLHTGATWVDTTECGDGGKQEATTEVIRTERVTVAAGQIDTFVIKTVTETDEGTSEITQWYAPEARLAVLIEQEVRSDQFGAFKVTIEALSFTPQTA